MNRRKFLKYAGATGVVAGASALGVGYFTTRPAIQSQPALTMITSVGQTPVKTGTATSALNQYWPTIELWTSPQYVAALEGQPVDIHGRLFDQDRDELDYTLMINGQTVNKGKASYRTDLNDYPELLYTTKPNDLVAGKNTPLLTVSDGVHSAHNGRELYVDEDLNLPKRNLNVKIKGIVYVMGMGAWSLLAPTIQQMEEDLYTIRNEFGCNGIRINSDVDSQVLKCGETAINQGFECIILNPRYINATPEQTIKNITEFAKKAEALRKTSDAVQLQVGNELSVDALGMMPGNDWSRRASNLAKGIYNPNWEERLVKLLNDLLSVARENFEGEISYAAGNYWEKIPYESLGFDIVCSNEYVYSGNFSDVETALRNLMTYGREVYQTEYGSCTYPGACFYGGAGAAHSGAYSEDAQRECIKKYLEIDSKVKPTGCFLWTYYEPVQPWRTEAQSFGIMKMLQDQQQMLTRKKAAYELASWTIKDN